MREVGGDRVDVNSITKPGAEIHGYEPTPGDLRRAASADLVIQNGMNLESWFEQFIDDARAPSVSLTDIDPAGADYFAANAERYKAQLSEIREDAKRSFRPLHANRRALVSCEGAFSYLARDYGLTEQYLWPVPIGDRIAREPDRSPLLLPLLLEPHLLHTRSPKDRVWKFFGSGKRLLRFRAAQKLAS